MSSQLYGVQVHGFRLRHLPKIGWVDMGHQFYLKISIGDSVRTTSVVGPEKSDSIQWTSNHKFNVHDPATLTLKVFARRKLHDDEYIGEVQRRVNEVLRNTDDIDLRHPPRVGLIAAEHRDYYVQPCVDENDESTTADLSQTTKLALNVRASSTISLKVFAKRRMHHDECIGMVKESVKTLLAHQDAEKYCLVNPDGHDDKLPDRASMRFNVIPLHHWLATEHDTSQLTESPVARVPDAVSFTSGSGTLNECIELGSVVFSPLLGKIKIFVDLAEKFAEAHPYIKMAFTILSAAYKVLKSQLVRDQCVCRLASVMHDTYSLISSVDGLKRIESQAKTITFLAYQTMECSYFIRDYMKHKSGWKNSISNAWSNIDDRVQGYVVTFIALKNAIHNQTAIHTQLYVFRLYDLTLDHAVKADLKDMRYAAGASYRSHRIGSAPPRIDIIDSITSWVNHDSELNQDIESQIYLLLGSNESEKSTIAHVIAQKFDVIARLGSSYFFSGAAQDKRNATNFFSTIAHDLADHDPQYKDALWDIVKSKRSLRESDDPLTQFTSFILGPAGRVAFVGPVLVVVDGLEYSGTESAHKDLLTVLAKEGAKLPNNFKFLITCRPDDSVCTAFKGKSHVREKHLSYETTPRSTSTLDGPSSGSAPSLSYQDVLRKQMLRGNATRNSPSTLDSSSSCSAVPSMFSQDYCRDSDEESLPSSVDEELQPSNKQTNMQYQYRRQTSVTEDHFCC